MFPIIPSTFISFAIPSVNTDIMIENGRTADFRTKFYFMI